jgi:hypothetical protein
VPEQEFLFALDISGDPPFDGMLAELARAVLGHVGCGSAAIDAVTGQLGAQLSERAANGRRRCEVRFRARGGELEIIVAGAGRPDWRTTCPLPAP